jgi:hypothetical protein
VFSAEAKKDEAAKEDALEKLGKVVRDLSLDVKASKWQDLQKMSLKNRQELTTFV